MDSKEFLSYRKFINESDAIELCQLLSQRNIDSKMQKSASYSDASFGGSELSDEYIVKIASEDFNWADEVVKEQAQKIVDGINEDYYLHEFTDEELMEIIGQPHQWSMIDFLMAQKILKQRGKDIHPELAEILRKQKNDELSKLEVSSPALIVVGYVFAILGGIFGLFIGLHLLTHTKILPNGDKIKAYATSDRNHGLIIFSISVVTVTVGLLFKYFIR